MVAQFLYVKGSTDWFGEGKKRMCRKESVEEKDGFYSRLYQILVKEISDTWKIRYLRNGNYFNAFSEKGIFLRMKNSKSKDLGGGGGYIMNFSEDRNDLGFCSWIKRETDIKEIESPKQTYHQNGL